MFSCATQIFNLVHKNSLTVYLCPLLLVSAKFGRVDRIVCCVNVVNKSIRMAPVGALMG